jgi:hypothetical protein
LSESGVATLSEFQLASLKKKGQVALSTFIQAPPSRVMSQ